MIYVIIPSYNSPNWVERAVWSVHQQSHKDWHVVVVDDASTDPKHWKQAATACQGCNGKATLLRNEQNKKALYSIARGIGESGAQSDDIIFILDGDDFIPDWALQHIAEAYDKYPNLWLTYGQYRPDPGGWAQEPAGWVAASGSLAKPAHEYPTFVRWDRSFRSYDQVCFNHPITFKRFLWDALDEADLKDDDGRWFEDGYDQAIMYPMLEMATSDHYACIEMVLYNYNEHNPMSEWRLINAGAMTPRIGQIRTRPPKAPLEH